MVGKEVDAGERPYDEPREYVQLRPTTDGLEPEQVAQAFRELHAISPHTESSKPVIEVLLCTPEASHEVAYLFGIEGARLGALERALDVGFPNSYERTRVTQSLTDLLTGRDPNEPAGTRPATESNPERGHETETETRIETKPETRRETSTATASGHLSERPVAGLEVCATEESIGDWRTRLTPLDAFCEDGAADRATWPLTGVITALAKTEHAAVFQALYEPMDDWSATRDSLVGNLRNGTATTPFGKFIEEFTDLGGESTDRSRPKPSKETRAPAVQSKIEELEAVDPRRCFTVNARILAFGDAPAPDDGHSDAVDADTTGGSNTEATRSHEPRARPEQTGTNRSDLGDDARILRSDGSGVGHDRAARGTVAASSTNPDTSEGDTKQWRDRDDPTRPDGTPRREQASPGTGSAETDLAKTLARFEDAFAALSYTSYRISTKRYGTDSTAAIRLAGDVATRAVRGETAMRRYLAHVPLLTLLTSPTQSRIVADPSTAGGFCLIGGESLPEHARRAIRTKPTDSVPRPLPPVGVLERYRTDGFRLGPPKTSDETVEPEISLPPALQGRHIAIVGQTGSGKTILALKALLENHAATDGATILFETKDGVLADQYTQCHYARYGTLEDVYRFDAHERLPATPVLDIEPAMTSGLSRTQAVDNAIEQLETVLIGVMGIEAYREAKTARRVIKAVLRALFDPVHGHDRVTLLDIQETLARLHHTEVPPPVVDESLRNTLASIVSNSQDTRTEIIQAAARRVDELLMQRQLAPQFTYLAASDDGRYRPGARTLEDAERFDWREKLDEDCVIIIDSSALEPTPQRTLTLLTLSQIWTALRRRQRERRLGKRADDPPLVNIHIEEAAEVASAGVLDRLLNKGRSFGVSLSLSMQFLGQLEGVDQATYREAINNTGTIIAGQTNRDRALADRLATTEMPPEQVANRLRALDAGEWLCSLPAGFGEERPPPFTIGSGPLPVGHPDTDRPLSASQVATFQAATARMRHSTSRYGLSVTDGHGEHRSDATADTGGERSTASDRPNTDDHRQRPPATAQAAAGGEEWGDRIGLGENAGRPTIDTTGPLTSVMPEPLAFDGRRNAWLCETCSSAHPATLQGLLDAVTCHGDLEDVARETIPTVHVGCTVAHPDRRNTPYSDHQFAFMQLLHNVRRDPYDHDYEFDIVWDSMDRLAAYAGLDGAGLSELITDGLVVKDTDRPHRLFSLTAEGRKLLDVPYREGIDHGDGAGDLGESNFHVMLVEALVRYCHRQFVSDSTHPGVRVEPYYGVEDGRLDVAVLDADGSVVVACEAERANNDLLRAAPHDFDKMASVNPQQAIWLVPNRRAGHEVIRALHSPLTGSPRLPRTYSEETHLPRITFDEPGFTDILSIETLRNHLK